MRNLGEMANDVDGLEAAIREALEAPSDGPDAKPTLLVLRSHIGWPSPKLTDTAAAHGSPFGADEIRVTKELLGLPPDETFWVPDEVRAFYGQEVARGGAYRKEWEERFAAWDGDRVAWEAAQAGRGIPGWADKLPTFEAGTKLATRHAINQCINATSDGLPGLVAGSADLTGNNGVAVKGAEIQAAETPGGRAAALRHPRARDGRGHERDGRRTGACSPSAAPSSSSPTTCVRRCAWPRCRRAHVIYSWTHDSIGLGEDGPTHQPVEQLASLRAMPGLILVRPADANETAQAWRLAVESDEPVGLALTRQDVPVLAETAGPGRSRAWPRAATCWRRPSGDAADRADRHRERGAAVPGGGQGPGRRRGADPGRLAAVLGVVRGAGRRLPGRGAAPPACPPSASRRARPSGGAATPTTPSGSTASGRRPPARWPWKSWASRLNMWSNGHMPSWARRHAEHDRMTQRSTTNEQGAS